MVGLGQAPEYREFDCKWIPAFAGMTKIKEVLHCAGVTNGKGGLSSAYDE